MTDDAEIRRILEDQRAALHAKDAEALAAHDAPDILSYDLAPPLPAAVRHREYRRGSRPGTGRSTARCTISDRDR